MNKKIEDYLHLYLGCDVKWGADTVRLIDTDGVNCNVHGEFIGTTKCNTSIKNISPILRPLSSMTIDEKKANKDFMAIGEKFDLHFFEEIVDAAKYYHWLLSKHFDLFGLIEDGLAIDATTLK